METQQTPEIVIIGHAWYGNWAKDVAEACTAAGLKAYVIYVNSAPGGGDAAPHGIAQRVKSLLRRYAQPLFLALKYMRAWYAEWQTVRFVHSLRQRGAEVLVLCVWTPPAPWLLRRLKRAGVTLILWQGEPGINNPRWAATLPYFDVLTNVEPDWNKYFPEQERSRIHTLPLATNEQVHRFLPAPAEEKYCADVSVVTVYKPEKARMLEILKDGNFKFRIYGHGWKEGFREFPWLARVYGGPLSPEEVNKVMNCSKISIGAIGISFEHSWDQPGPTASQRVFDISSAGRFQISQHSPLTEKLFGDSVATFKTAADMKRLVVYYLTHREERELLAGRAQEITLREHTYRARVNTILEIYNSIAKSSEKA